MDWCKGVTFYEKLAQYHLRYAEYLANRYGFNFSYDAKLLGLYKDKKQMSNMSYYKGNFDDQFYDCILAKYNISRVQLEELMVKMETTDFSSDIVSSVVDTFSYTNYDVHTLTLEYKESKRLNNKVRTFKNHVKDKAILDEIKFDGFTFPRPLIHIKKKIFKIECNIDGLGYECFSHYYKNLTLPPQTLKLDKLTVNIPVTDHVIQKGKLISFDQRVIINLNEPNQQ